MHGFARHEAPNCWLYASVVMLGGAVILTLFQGLVTA